MNDIRTAIENMLTLDQVCRMFNKSTTTIYLWRKHRAMPSIRMPTQASPLLFDETEIRAWAKKTGKAIQADPGPATA